MLACRLRCVGSRGVRVLQRKPCSFLRRYVVYLPQCFFGLSTDLPPLSVQCSYLGRNGERNFGGSPAQFFETASRGNSRLAPTTCLRREVTRSRIATTRRCASAGWLIRSRIRRLSSSRHRHLHRLLRRRMANVIVPRTTLRGLFPTRTLPKVTQLRRYVFTVRFSERHWRRASWKRVHVRVVHTHAFREIHTVLRRAFNVAASGTGTWCRVIAHHSYERRAFRVQLTMQHVRSRLRPSRLRSRLRLRTA